MICMRQIEVLGVSIKDYSLREAMKKVDDFMKDGKLSTIAYITAGGLLAAETSDSLKEFLENVDLTVTADSEILRAADIVNRNRMREIDNDEFMQEFLKKIVRMKKSVYLLTGSNQQMEVLKQGLFSFQEKLDIIGTYSLDLLEEQGHDVEYLVNEMNVAMPGVIISNISSPQREQFFEENHMKLNARVWLMLKDEVVHQKLSQGVFAKVRDFLIKQIFTRQVNKYRSESEEKDDTQ